MNQLSTTVMNKISTLKKQNHSDFVTNYFLNFLDHNAKLFESNNSLVILQPEDNFFRVYFATTDLTEFSKLLNTLPNDQYYSLEIIEHGDISAELKTIISNKIPYDTRFERMRVPLNKFRKMALYPPEEITYATPSDAMLIFNELHRAFHQYSSHLPTQDELLKMINDLQVIVIRSPLDNQINSFLIYTVNGIVSHFNQLLNIRGQNFELLKLIDFYHSRMIELGIKNLYLWVDSENNKKVQRLHYSYGFRSDGTSNYVFATPGTY